MNIVLAGLLLDEAFEPIDPICLLDPIFRLPIVCSIQEAVHIPIIIVLHDSHAAVMYFLFTGFEAALSSEPCVALPIPVVVAAA